MHVEANEWIDETMDADLRRTLEAVPSVAPSTNASSGGDECEAPTHHPAAERTQPAAYDPTGAADGDADEDTCATCADADAAQVFSAVVSPVT